jgi:NitT/TauT family transport system substrate-binding protein
MLALMNSARKTFGLIALTLIALLSSLLIKSCTLGGEVALKPFKVGMNSWPGYAIALYAKEAGLFKKRGLDVEFVRFTNQQDNIRATMRGSQDASFVPLWEVMQVDPAGDKPVVMMVVDISAGSDGIAASSAIKTPKDLRGQKVSTKLGTVTHLILLEALKSNQLKPTDVEIVDASNDRGAELLKKGEVSAAVMWEPLLSNTAKAVGGKVIHTTADVDSIVIDTLASRSSVVNSKQDELVSFIETWFDTIQAVETKPQEVFASVAKQTKQTVEAFTEDYKGLKKGDIAMNNRMFTGGRLQEASKLTSELLREDPRHGRIIRDDVEINAVPLNKAIANWKA